MKKGIFIAVEGIDGCGSTTQAKKLGTYLTSRQHQVHVTAEPSSGPLGGVLRRLLKERLFEPYDPMLALAFAADRLFHYETEIRPPVERGGIVISDRYVLSSLVYQGLALPTQWISQINQHAPAADVTIVIDVAEEESEQRRKNRDESIEIFDTLKTQSSLRQRYLSLAATHHNKAIIVDGNAPADVVFERLIFALEDTLQTRF